MGNSYTISIQIDTQTKGADQVVGLEQAILKLAGASNQATRPTGQLVDAFGNTLSVAPKASKAVAEVGQAAAAAATGEGKLSDQADEAAKALDDQGEAAGKAAGKTRDMGHSIASGYAQVELLKAGIEKLYTATRQAWTGFTELETKLVNIRTLSALTDQQFRALSAEVVAMSTRVPQSAANLADGLYQLQSAGVDAQVAVKGTNGQLGALELAARAATAGLATTEQAVDVGTSILNAFRKPVTDLEGDFDVLFQTVNLGKTTFPELSQSMGLMLPRAAATGTNLHEVSAALVELTNQGIKTPEAVTRISEAIRALSTPNPEAQPFFRQLGIQWNGLLDTIRQVKEKGLSNADLKRLVPDQQAYDAVLALTHNYDGLIGTLDRLKDSAGATANAFALQADTTASKTQILNNQMAALATQGMEGVARIVVPILTGLTKLAGILGPLPDGLKSVALGMVVLEGGTLAAVAALETLGITVTMGLGPISAIVLAIGALAAGVGYLATMEDEASKARTRNNAAALAQLKTAEGLTREYRQLAKGLEDGTLKGKARADSEARLKTLKDELIKISPDYQEALSKEKDGLLAQADAFDKVYKKGEDLQRQKYEQSKQRLALMEAALRETQEALANPDVYAAEGFFVEADRQVKVLTKSIQQLKQELAPSAARFEPKAAPTKTKTAEEIAAEEEERRRKLREQSKLLTQQQLEAARKTAEAESTKVKDILDREKTQLEASFATNQVGIAAYYARLKEVELKALDDLIAMKTALRAKEAQSTSNPGEVAKLTEEIAVLERKKQDVITATGRAEVRSSRALADEIWDAQAQVLDAQGETAKARALQIDQQYRELLAKLVANSDLAGQEIVNKLIQVEKAKARADQLRASLDFTQAQLAADETGIQNLQQQGLITSLQAQELRAQAIEAKLPAMRAALAQIQAEALAAQEAAKASGKPEDQKAAANLALQAQQMSNTVSATTSQLAQLKDAWGGVKQAGADAMANGLYNTLMAVGKGAGAVSSAFNAMATDIVASLQKVLTKMLLMKAMEAMFSGAAANGNTWAQSAIKAFGGSYAGGGYTGPGGKYEPAGLVHRGEYVHDQETTDFWGTRFLASLHPRNFSHLAGFATGGQVGPPSVGAIATSLSPNLNVMPIIVYDMETALEKAAQAPRGTKAIIRVVNDNPEALGGR